MCDDSDVSAAFTIVEPLLESPPFPYTVAEFLLAAVQRSIAIETARGEIARAERSALDSQAQPLPDLLDRIRFCLAGLTAEVVWGLEHRLARMTRVSTMVKRASNQEMSDADGG